MPLSPEAEERLTARLRDALAGPLTPEELAEGRARWGAARARQAEGGEDVSADPLRPWTALAGRGAPPRRATTRREEARPHIASRLSGPDRLVLSVGQPWRPCAH